MRAKKAKAAPSGSQCRLIPPGSCDSRRVLRAGRADILENGKRIFVESCKLAGYRACALSKNVDAIVRICGDVYEATTVLQTERYHADFVFAVASACSPLKHRHLQNTYLRAAKL